MVKNDRKARGLGVSGCAEVSKGPWRRRLGDGLGGTEVQAATATKTVDGWGGTRVRSGWERVLGF